MSVRLFVGNIPYQVTADELKDLFSSVGEVESATIVTERESGKSRGFGFVTMKHAATAHLAIDKLDGLALTGRTISVKEARPRRDSSG